MSTPQSRCRLQTLHPVCPPGLPAQTCRHRCRSPSWWSDQTLWDVQKKVCVEPWEGGSGWVSKACTRQTMAPGHTREGQGHESERSTKRTRQPGSGNVYIQYTTPGPPRQSILSPPNDMMCRLSSIDAPPKAQERRSLLVHVVFNEYCDAMVKRHSMGVRRSIINTRQLHAYAGGGGAPSFGARPWAVSAVRRKRGAIIETPPGQ